LPTRGPVLLAAGGTGGHLFPAEALARALAERGWRIHLATDRRTENYGRDFPAEAIHVITAATLTRSVGGLVASVTRLARGFMESRRMIRDTRPEAAVGFGGYPTVPPMLAASFARVPTIIHEANAVLGRANAFLAKRVGHIAVAVPGVVRDARLRDRVTVTGNPIRPAVREAAHIPYPARTLAEPFRLLVFGGSQGARVFAGLVPGALALLPKDTAARIVITQQARPEDAAAVADVFRGMGVAAEVAPFFADLPRRMADSHLVVGRSGASTCAELAAIGRPSILVPLPNALDHDQTANARVLASAGAAVLAPQASLTPERLARHLAEAIADPAAMATMASKARALGKPDAVERLADLVEQAIARKSSTARAGVTA
jgi:UDP-N-acetylglucosamine--N-acetylmuramyl-(pentapeptide) pyrophosphoryl-undecaprenol N-acetylglucosamine transferase